MAGSVTRRSSRIKKNSEVEKSAYVSDDKPDSKPQASPSPSSGSSIALSTKSATAVNQGSTGNPILSSGSDSEYVDPAGSSKSPPTKHYVNRRKVYAGSSLKGGVRRSVTARTTNGRKTAATTFHFFAKLPPELRTKIWKYTIPDARVIQVKVDVVHSKFSGHLRGLHLKSHTPPPSILHACHESRVVGLGRYELSFKTHLSGPRTYVDYSRDTIYFGDVNLKHTFTLASLLRDMPEEEVSKIKYLALAQNLWNGKAYCNCHVLRDFPSLVSLTMVMERGDAAKTKHVSLIEPKKKDYTYCRFYDMDMGGLDELADIQWPFEMDDILQEQFMGILVDGFDDGYDDDGWDLPDLSFRVLVPADKVRVGKGKKAVHGK